MIPTSPLKRQREHDTQDDPEQIYQDVRFFQSALQAVESHDIPALKSLFTPPTPSQPFLPQPIVHRPRWLALLLIFAAEQGHLDVIELLLPFLRPSRLSSPAIQSASVEPTNQSPPSAQSANQQPLLNSPAKTPHPDRASAADDYVVLSFYQSAVNQALVAAAEAGHDSVVQYLISKAGATPSYRKHMPFRMACERGHLATAQWLHAQGADIHAVDDFAMSMAAQQGHLHVCQWLVTLVEPPIDHSSSASSLSLSSSSSSSSSSSLSLSSRISPADSLMSCDDNYPLIWAARCGRSDVVRWLLTSPAVSVSARDHLAVAFAAGNGHVETLELLLQHGGCSDLALIHASEGRHVIVARWLDQHYRHSITPLLRAAAHCFFSRQRGAAQPHEVRYGGRKHFERFLSRFRVVDAVVRGYNVSSGVLRHEKHCQRCAGERASEYEGLSLETLQEMIPHPDEVARICEMEMARYLRGEDDLSHHENDDDNDEEEDDDNDDFDDENDIENDDDIENDNDDNDDNIDDDDDRIDGDENDHLNANDHENDDNANVQIPAANDQSSNGDDEDNANDDGLHGEEEEPDDSDNETDDCLMWGKALDHPVQIYPDLGSRILDHAQLLDQQLKQALLSLIK